MTDKAGPADDVVLEGEAGEEEEQDQLAKLQAYF